MTDPEKEMESYLSRFRRKVPPPGFKEQLLGRVEERRKLEQVITPARWKIAVACLALIVIFLGANFFINRTEERYLSAFLDIKQATESGIVEEALPSVLADVPELAGLENSPEILKRRIREKAEPRKQKIEEYLNLLNIKEEYNGS
ncbi:MAG TPA: hypothetical protein P5517_07030 [Candidatus Saccharicenans sp.]|nr:hypothetical protein [Candidatus Saccharicenans sp.]